MISDVMVRLVGLRVAERIIDVVADLDQALART
jgi:hypothetical protein